MTWCTLIIFSFHAFKLTSNYKRNFHFILVTMYVLFKELINKLFYTFLTNASWLGWLFKWQMSKLCLKLKFENDKEKILTYRFVFLIATIKKCSHLHSVVWYRPLAIVTLCIAVYQDTTIELFINVPQAVQQKLGKNCCLLKWGIYTY